MSKTNIGVGHVVTSKVRYMEVNKSKLRSRVMRKEVVGCFQDVVGKNNFPD